MGLCLKLLGVVAVLVAILLGFLISKVPPPPTRVTFEDIQRFGGKFVQLKDGRFLEYFDIGDPNSQRVVLALHGAYMEGSYFANYDSWARTNNIRIIAPTLPDWCCSDWKPNRNFIDWVSDAQQLLDHLKLDKVAAVGISAGSPHALVLATQIPERLNAVAVLAGFSDFTTGEVDAFPYVSDKFMMSLFGMFPKLKDICLSMLREVALQDTRGFFALSFPGEVAFLDSRPERAEWYYQSARKSVNVSYIGHAETMRLSFLQPWGFTVDCSKVKGPVIIAHGEKDEIVTVLAARNLASKISNSKLIVYPNGYHFFFLDQLEDVILQLFAS